MRKAIADILPEAAWQRCYVHFLRNALDCLPRKADDDCLLELRWLYARRNLAEAQHDLAAWLTRAFCEETHEGAPGASAAIAVIHLPLNPLRRDRLDAPITGLVVA